jgi:hypothetical protein
LLAFPFGAALLLALFLCIIATEGVLEFDENIRALLNGYMDLNDSVYIVLLTVSRKILKIIYQKIHTTSRINSQLGNTICIIAYGKNSKQSQITHELGNKESNEIKHKFEFE